MALHCKVSIGTKWQRLPRQASNLVLGAGLIFAPAIVAQTPTDPTQSQQQPQQQTQQQQQPSVAHGAGSMPVQQDSMPTPGMTGEELKDKVFLRMAAQGGMAEVRLGQLAADKGASDAVKNFGSRMVADHTLLNNQMKPIADSMGVRLPKEISKEDQAEFDKLSALSGDEFDREYITAMLKDHHKDVREFRIELTATTDPTLKDAVEAGEKVIREHTHMITEIAKSRDIPIPGHHGAETASPQ